VAGSRAAPAVRRGGWASPGGRVAAWESVVAALVREGREELGVEIDVGTRVGGDWPLAGDGYVMRAWLSRIVSGTPEVREHLELRWLEPGSYFDVAWLTADLPLMEAVEKLLGQD